MITVPEATKKIVERSRYLSEAISKNLINHSSLARYIQPEIETMLIKKVSKGSIVMALKRLEASLKPKYSKGSIFKSPPEMMVRSGMFLTTIKRTKETEEIVGKIFLNRVKGTFSSVTIGATEFQIVGNLVLFEKLEKNLNKNLFVSTNQNISQITIYLPDLASKTPGIYYFFLKSLAWEGINILGSASTTAEFTLFFEDHDINRAFEVLSSLFTKKVI
ncbi:MAG: hypothetical protein Q7T54_02375 [Candidatus Levybacteria bacterium]|nr:hypothetical protein [Candidatus Levybacteria bacterium]